MQYLSEIVLGLTIAVVALSVLARVAGVPYPIVLVLGGLVISLIPGVPKVAMNPDLVLALFLPPLLYSAAFFANLRDLRADLRSISLAAVGLVVVTAVLVAVVAHALIDGLPWAVAFTLGAIVAPTDPLAATTIAQRLGAPRRLVSIIEGEGLLNDGTALVIYRVAIAAAVGGGFSAGETLLRFFGGAAGGIAIGLVVGWLVAEVRRRLDDVPVEITISLGTAYAAYLPAEALGVSGALAAVTTGIYMGWRAPEISTPSMRMQGAAVWQTLQFLLNAVLFVLIGLQLPVITGRLGGYSAATLAGYSAAIAAAVIGARLLWVNTTPYIIRLLDRRPQQRARRASWRVRFVVFWAGMRGAVSLAAALAIPLETHAGTAFPQRDLVIFLTFAVILVTLVLQGLTLPAVIRALGVTDDGSAEQQEEVTARLAAADAALQRLEELQQEEWTRDDTIDRMRALYQYRQRRFAARADGDDPEGIETRSLAYQRTQRSVLEVQRATIWDLRRRGVISDDVMHRIERELDLEDERLEI
ncbi:MAG: Na+/H+ antiporter [Thermoleophilaceae bacterium]